MDKVVISSGHGKYIRGASGFIDEVDEARKVVEQVAKELREFGVETITYHDDVSDDQSENLNRIVDFHNAQGPHDLDVSVHFNAYEETLEPMGCEVLYVSSAGNDVAELVVDAICDAAPLINRGAKKRTDLFFLNNTAEVACLIETCFVDSQADVDVYHAQFEEICLAIASAIAGEESAERPPITPPERPPVEPPSDALFYAKGTCSWFGGPDDDGVSASEGLAFIYPDDFDEFRHLFLPEQPPNTTGMARRLDADRVFYLACRWDYSLTPKDMLRNQTRKALVRAKGKQFYAYPADWGPHEEQTGRAADLSPALMEALGVTTDDIVEVIYPAPD